jgi:purine catabolism regulator
LRYRLRRIVELLGSDLDDPTQRAELWLALRLREGAPLGES